MTSLFENLTPVDADAAQALASEFRKQLSGLPFTDSELRDVASFAARVDLSVRAAAAQTAHFHDEPSSFAQLLLAPARN